MSQTRSQRPSDASVIATLQKAIAEQDHPKAKMAIREAVARHLRINEKHPVIWAVENDTTIKPPQGEDGIGAVAIYDAICKHKVDSRQFFEWALKNTQEITTIAGKVKVKDKALIIAFLNQEKIYTTEEQQGLHPMEWAIKHAVTVYELPALQFAGSLNAASAYRLENPIAIAEKYGKSDQITDFLLSRIGATIDEQSVGAYCADKKIDLVSYIIDSYDQKPKLRKQLSEAHDDFRAKALDVRTPNPTPALDNLLKESPQTIARIISSQKKGDCVDLSVEALTQNCSLETLHKIAKIGAELDKSARKDAAQLMKNGLNKFVNAIRNLAGKGVTNTKLANAIAEMKKFSTVAKNVLPKKDSHLGKFVSKLSDPQDIFVSPAF